MIVIVLVLFRAGCGHAGAALGGATAVLRTANVVPYPVPWILRHSEGRGLPGRGPRAGGWGLRRTVAFWSKASAITSSSSIQCSWEDWKAMK